MPPRVPGSLDLTRNPMSVNDGTSIRFRSSPSGPQCTTNDPNWLDRINQVRMAISASDSKVVAAIQRHTGEEFQSLVQSLVPGLLLALSALMATTLAGGAIGALFGGGVGAAPGAVFGFEVGLALLNYLGIGFLAYYVLERMDEVTSCFGRGIRIAWYSCGDDRSMQAAANEFAEGVGIFFRLVLQALVLYLLKAASEMRVSSAIEKLGESRLFQSAPKLREWLSKNYRRVGEKFGMQEATLQTAVEFIPPNTRTFTYDMVNNPGPLANTESLATMRSSAAGNFFGGKYNEMTLTQPTILYRAQPGQGTVVSQSASGEVASSKLARRIGRWFAPQPPASGAIARIDSALRHQWIDAEGIFTGSSAAEVVLAVRIPAGAKIYYGPVGSQGGVNVGGLDKIQIFIPELDKLRGVLVVTETQLQAPRTQGVIDALKKAK